MTVRWSNCQCCSQWLKAAVVVGLILTVELAPFEDTRKDPRAPSGFRQSGPHENGGSRFFGALPPRWGLVTVPSTALAQKGPSTTPVDLEALEIRYRKLLEQKAALLNNKSYQKRKIKRKYKHRPHIQRLKAEEERVEGELEAIESLAPQLKEKYAGGLPLSSPGDDKAY